MGWIKGPVLGCQCRPVETGTCEPQNLNRIAYRTNSAAFFLGDIGWKHTVRGNGCASCPVRCHTMIKVPSVTAKYGIPAVGQNTCAGLMFGSMFFRKFPDGPKGNTNLEACMVGMHLADDLGVWCNYLQMQRDFQKLYYDGIIEKKLGSKEFNSYSWKKYEQGDPSFLFELFPRIAAKDGELGTALGLGTGYLLERWSIAEKEWGQEKEVCYWKMGHPKHHSPKRLASAGSSSTCSTTAMPSATPIPTSSATDCRWTSRSSWRRKSGALRKQLTLSAHTPRCIRRKPEWPSGPFSGKSCTTRSLSATGWGRGSRLPSKNAAIGR